MILSFCVDILITFNTGYYVKGGQFINDRKSIASKYLTGLFISDILA